MIRVFVSSTSNDLKPYRLAIGDVVHKFKWYPVMMEHFETAPEHTVDYCRNEVRQCDVLLLIVAFRRGAIPPKEMGGDGVLSYTWYEVETARRLGMPMLALMANEQSWPVGMAEHDPLAHKWIRGWRDELRQVATFFDHERDPQLPGFREIVRSTLNNHREWRQNRIAEALKPGPGQPRARGAREAILLKLEKILQHIGFPCEVIRRRFGEVESERRNLLPEQGDALVLMAEAAKHLVHLPQRSVDDRWPYVDFFYRLLQDAEGLEQELLKEYVGYVLQMLGDVRSPPIVLKEEPTVVPPQEIVPIPASRDFHVMIFFRESAVTTCAKESTRPHEPEYHVRAWMYQRGQPVPLAVDAELWTRENRIDKLGLLCQEAANRGPASGRMILEFLVPRRLLNENLEEWKLFLDVIGERPVGRYCPMVIRLLERASAVNRPQWESRWRKIDERLSLPCSLVDLLEGSDDAPTALWISAHSGAENLCALLRREERVASVVFEKPPPALLKSRSMDAFGAVIQAGVPIVLWPRSSRGSRERLREELLALLHGKPLRDLPARLYDYRTEPEKKPLPIALLWDDPTRPLPSLDNEPAQPMGIEVL